MPGPQGVLDTPTPLRADGLLQLPVRVALPKRKVSR